MKAAREYGLTITAFRALPEVDRLLAVALSVYEGRHCSGCGQDMTYSMDPALAEHWSTMDPARCFACTALAGAQKRTENSDHPHALRHVVGLREGWEDVLAAGRERAAPDQ